jgi:hypothetical protein
VLVQSGLYPHAGYDERIQLLTPESLHDPRHRGAVVLIAPAISAYPFRAQELAGLKKLRPLCPMPSGIVISRISDAPVPVTAGGKRDRSRLWSTARPSAHSTPLGSPVPPNTVTTRWCELAEGP